METTTTTTVDIATAANYSATALVEELLKRDQGMFDSAEILATLDLVDTAVSLAIEAEPAMLVTLSEVAAAGRAKASGQPLLDAPATKGGLLLDLWAGLESLR
ncbi:MAG: hypothetical protein QOE80_1007 [Actinomycetota bacterium]|jgi:hypothetical protein|nr:hypothetical protein [Actinomycetota bacterium]